MKLVARLSTCLLLAFFPALLGHCGGATNGGSMGTETGNPPVVDSKKLRLVADGGGAELVGEPGAVTSRASVRLDNRSTGDSAVVTANADGSFRVQVAGTALDDYEITVTAQGRSVTADVGINSTAEPPVDLATLSCEQLESSLPQLLSSAYEPFNQTCTSDDDCVIQYWGGCFVGCGASYVLGAQSASAVAAAEQSIAPTCSEIEQRGCTRPPTPSCAAPDAIKCQEGTCRGVPLADLSCEELSTRAGQAISAEGNFDYLTRTCNSNADCAAAILPPLSCTSSCSNVIAVATSAVADAQQAVSLVENSLCRAFSQRGCEPPPRPPCLPPTEVTPVCLGGQCQLP